MDPGWRRRFEHLDQLLRTRMKFGVFPPGIPPPFNYQETPLVTACINRNVDEVKSLLLQEANPNTFRIQEFSPLHWAVYRRDVEIITLLTNKDRSFGRFYSKLDQDCFYVTPLMMAIYLDYPEVVTLLLQLGANQSELVHGFTSLATAIAWHRDTYVKLLLPDCQWEIEKDYLFLYAVRMGDKDLQTKLLPWKPDFNVQDYQGQSSRSYAMNTDDWDLVQIIRTATAPFSKPPLIKKQSSCILQ